LLNEIFEEETTQLVIVKGEEIRKKRKGVEVQLSPP
jgi:hypothetical protein